MENVISLAIFAVATAVSVAVAFLAAKACLGGLLRVLR